MTAALILLEHPSVKLAALLFLTVWCFARAYYFAFYVINALRRSGLPVRGAVGLFATPSGSKHPKTWFVTHSRTS